METELEQLRFDHAWEPVMAASGDKYAFPGQVTPHIESDYDRPAVYRWAIYRPGNPPLLLRAYIGETENLVRRITQDQTVSAWSPEPNSSASHKRETLGRCFGRRPNR